MRKPDANSNALTSAFTMSPRDWSSSPYPKNEERLAGQLSQPKTASRCICVNGTVLDAVVVASPGCKKVRICWLFRGFCRLLLRAARSHHPVNRADCDDA